jgi:hypothetical protein
MGARNWIAESHIEEWNGKKLNHAKGFKIKNDN